MSKTDINEAIEINFHKLGERIIELEKDSFKIVHCMDCKYFSQNDRWCERYECDEGCGSICWDLGEDGFCSKAEERIYCKDCKYFKLGKCYWRGDFEEAEKMNGVEIIREYPQPTNMNDWCGNGEKKDERHI